MKSGGRWDTFNIIFVSGIDYCGICDAERLPPVLLSKLDSRARPGFWRREKYEVQKVAPEEKVEEEEKNEGHKKKKKKHKKKDKDKEKEFKKKMKNKNREVR